MHGKGPYSEELGCQKLGDMQRYGRSLQGMISREVTISDCRLTPSADHRRQTGLKSTHPGSPEKALLPVIHVPTSGRNHLSLHRSRERTSLLSTRHPTRATTDPSCITALGSRPERNAARPVASKSLRAAPVMSPRWTQKPSELLPSAAGWPAAGAERCRKGWEDGKQSELEAMLPATAGSLYPAGQCLR